MTGHSPVPTTAAIGALVLLAALGVAAQAPAPTAVGAKTWLENREAIEQYIMTAEVVSLERIGTGVTNPWRAELAPGGLVSRVAWKPIRPGRYQGHWESYTSEIAAYELDKLLGLDMLPPKVEKRVNGERGAAIFWVAPAKNFRELGGVPTPPPAHAEHFNRDLLKAKMFDNLVGNNDPNLGNWLVDPEWNIILIDHSRALTTSRNLYHELQRVDATLWEKMRALSEERVTAAVGTWLGRNEIRAILQRRDRMQVIVDRLVATQGEARVFIR